MANINNINEAWGGQNPHTGAEVEQFIKGTLTTHENALNSAVYGMKFEVDETDNTKKRKNGTECILCFECAKNCPKDAL